MSYNVYLVESAGMPQDHHAVFVETNSDHSGWIYQVTGNIQMGMICEDKPGVKPEDDATSQGKTLIGTVAVPDYPRVKPICESMAVPKKQFQGPRRLYPDEPLRRCQEWTKDAIVALRDAQVVAA